VICEARDLHKTFVQAGTFPWSPRREVPAVRGVDLTVAPGEVVALVGQSGSGKTTLARMVLGLEEPDQGTIDLEGVRWHGLSERARQPRRVRYQYVPQDALSALDPQQTVLEHVEETLRVLVGCDRHDARARAMAMLERLGLPARANSLPRQLSGGEQRRVTLARVLALEPRLVVADEPTSGLEPDRRQAVLRDLVGNLPESAGCILVTHEMAAARAWAHRALVMLGGRVIEEVDLRRDEPTHPYAKLLFAPWDHDVPDAPLATSGCPWRHGCPLMDDALADTCARGLPALTPLSPGHGVACHFHHRSSS